MLSHTLPIKLSDSFEGLAESKGLISITEEGLNIQFQTKDAILGMVKSDLKEVKLPLSHITEIAFKKSIFGSKLVLTVDDLRLIDKLPNSDNNEIILSIARKNVDHAIDFIRAIKMDMSEKAYQEALKDNS